MKWTDEARAYFEKVPPFVRPMAKKGVEAFARRRGYATVTVEILREAKEKMMPDKGGHVLERGNWGKLDRQTSRLQTETSRFFAREGVDPLKYAFEKKTAVHAGAGGTYLEGLAVQAAWEASAGKSDDSRLRTVYVHIPFCRGRCRFCGFYMHNLKSDSSRVYIDALLDEIRQGADLPAVTDAPILAVYLGGGTPTDLEADDLERLLSGIHRYLPLSNDCEITVEGRVDGFTDEKMDACIRSGANRFSLGVQTFDTEVRRLMGRRASREEILDRLSRLTALNQAATIIDLIYGFPGQTMDIWEKDVRTFLDETDLDGCDMYQLNVFQGGPLATAIEEGRIEPAADIPVQAEMFSLGRRLAAKARLRRLSMCHWSRSTRERNRYNTFTRYGATCIPFGCGAGGRLSGHYFFQEGGLPEYYRRVREGEKPVATAMKLPEHSPLFRKLVGRMEEGALDLVSLGKRHGLDLNGIFGPLLSQWERTGLVRLDEDGWIELTEAGEFWNVNLAQALIDYFLLVTEGEDKPGAMAL